MADGFLPFQDPATIDKRLATTRLAIGGVDVDREQVVIAGEADGERARVKNSAPLAGDYGLVTRLIGMVTANGDTMVNDTVDALKIEIVSDLAGSIVDADDGSVAGGQTDIAVVLSLPYSFDGTNWARVTREQPSIVHNNHRTNQTTTAVDVTTSSAEALAANTSRKGLLLQNVSDTRIIGRFNAAPVATGGSEVGFAIEANGGAVGFSSLIDTRALNVIHAGTGNKRLLITEW